MLYGLYLIVLLLSFRKIHKARVSRGLGVFTFIVAIATSTALGWLFGLPDARPVYNANFLAMYFPLTGFGSALAAVLLFSLAYHHLAKIPLSEGDRNLYDDLGKLFGVVMVLTLIFFIWRTIVGGASATAVEFAGFRHMLSSGWYHLALVGWIGYPAFADRHAFGATGHLGKGDSRCFVFGRHVCRTSGDGTQRSCDANGTQGRRTAPVCQLLAHDLGSVCFCVCAGRPVVRIHPGRTKPETVRSDGINKKHNMCDAGAKSGRHRT